jgi:PadR family transcriptional regulator, regulatory protein PadR
MEQQKNEVLPGTLNLMALKTLSALGSLHGYGIARRIELISGNALQLNQGDDLSRPPAPGADGLDQV